MRQWKRLSSSSSSTSSLEWPTATSLTDEDYYLQRTASKWMPNHVPHSPSLSHSLTAGSKTLNMFKNRKKGITWGWWWRWWSTSSSSSAAKEWLHTKEKLQANFVVILIVGAAQLNGHEEGVAAANDQRGIVLVENVVLEGAVLLGVVALKQVHRGDVIWGA